MCLEAIIGQKTLAEPAREIEVIQVVIARWYTELVEDMRSLLVRLADGKTAGGNQENGKLVIAEHG